MNEPDVLERAAKALRAAHTGEREGSGFTRARIMTTLHGKRRRQLLRWAVFSPLASLVLVGSAWAHSAGKWPAVWQAVTSVLVAWPSKVEVPPPKAGIAVPPTQGAPRTAEPSEPEPPDTAEVPVQTPEVLAPAQPPPSVDPPRAQRRDTGQSIKPPPSPEPVGDRTPADPELARFRRAHDLHFRGDSPREAIGAYAAYLDEFPNGRFVPEARYNTALNWLKLGDKAAARVALTPFAEGRHGNYRRDEARRLLEAFK